MFGLTPSYIQKTKVTLQLPPRPDMDTFVHLRSNNLNTCTDVNKLNNDQLMKRVRCKN